MAFGMILLILLLALGVELAKQMRVSLVRDKIGLAVLTMLEQGQLQKLHNTWWYGKGECVVDDSKVGLCHVKCVSKSPLSNCLLLMIADTRRSQHLASVFFSADRKSEFMWTNSATDFHQCQK